jgi:hypothetical protein
MPGHQRGMARSFGEELLRGALTWRGIARSSSTHFPRILQHDILGRVAVRRVFSTRMLIALPQEHRSNFYRLQELSRLIQTHAPTHASDRKRLYGCCLVRFYATESGLKYLLSTREKVLHKHQTRDESYRETVESYGHDLNAMAKRLRVPANYGKNLSKIFSLSGGHKENGRPQPFPVARAHEAWRYGLGIVLTHQADLEEALGSLMERIATEI